MRYRTERSKFARQMPRGRRRTSRTQRDVLCDVMLAAGACAAASGEMQTGWLTLRELALLTRFGEASISAQLRHLRQPACGGFVVEKRLRDPGAMPRRPAQSGALWEYRLLAPARSKNETRPRCRGGVRQSFFEPERPRAAKQRAAAQARRAA